MPHSFPVLLSNVSLSAQTSWNYCAAVPKKYSTGNYYGKAIVDNDSSRSFPAAVIDGEFFVKATMDGQEGVLIPNDTGPWATKYFRAQPLKCTFTPCATPTAAGIGAFERSDWVPPDILDLFPVFRINSYTDSNTWWSSSSTPPVVWDGNPNTPEPVSYIKLESSNLIRKRYFVKTRITVDIPLTNTYTYGNVTHQRSIHIWGWIDLFSNQDVVPYAFNFSYNNVPDPGSNECDASETARLNRDATTGTYNFFDLNIMLGKMEMHTIKKCHLDYYRRKGLRRPYCSNTFERFITTLTNPKKWAKSRVFECYGAFLCAPSEYNTKPPAGQNYRIDNLVARKVGPICAFIDGWDDENLAYKVTGPFLGRSNDFPHPQPNPPFEDWTLGYRKVIEEEMTSVGDEMYNWIGQGPGPYGLDYSEDSDTNDQYNGSGPAHLNGGVYNENAWFTRKLTGYPESGSAGDITDFGASKNHGLMIYKKPWMIWDYRFQIQLWKMRRLSHLDSKGSLARWQDHPLACMVDLLTYFKPGPKLGPAKDARSDPYPNGNSYLNTDNLGHYMGEGYVGRTGTNTGPSVFVVDGTYSYYNGTKTESVQWLGEDDEHRSDNLLCGTLLVTKDPSVKNCVDHFVNCQMMNIDYAARYLNNTEPWNRPNAPRGQGRLMISMAHLISIGYNELIPRLERLVRFNCEAASFRLPQSDPQSTLPDATIKVIAYNGFKKTWNYANDPQDGANESILSNLTEQPIGWPPSDPGGTTVNGRVPAWVTWEHSIAVMGLWACWLTPQLSNQIRLQAKETALIVAKTIINEGYHLYRDFISETEPGYNDNSPITSIVSIYSQRRNLMRKGISWKVEYANARANNNTQLMFPASNYQFPNFFGGPEFPGGNPYRIDYLGQSPAYQRNKYIEFDPSYAYLLMPCVRLVLYNSQFYGSVPDQNIKSLDPDYARAYDIAKWPGYAGVFNANAPDRQFSTQALSWYPINPGSINVTLPQ